MPTKIRKNQGITFLFWLKRMQHTALVSKTKVYSLKAREQVFLGLQKVEMDLCNQQVGVGDIVQTDGLKVDTQRTVRLLTNIERFATP